METAVELQRPNDMGGQGTAFPALLFCYPGRRSDPYL